ncbi:hypothetical protein [Phaeospirillum tilakii]|uniref:Uncharacterized protein n=1 Tax=Phaeospirillum tilakii TaxID=741673 RepID=A0ABW5C8N3_9PROT
MSLYEPAAAVQRRWRGTIVCRILVLAALCAHIWGREAIPTPFATVEVVAHE